MGLSADNLRRLGDGWHRADRERRQRREYSNGSSRNCDADDRRRERASSGNGHRDDGSRERAGRGIDPA
jgi:hypothetical protein